MECSKEKYKVVDMTVKCILITLRYPSYNYLYLPVGAGILSERLIENNIEHEFFDLNLGSEDLLIEKIKNLNPKYICFSLLSLDIHINYALIKRIKDIFPDKIILVGGPHISFIKEEVFSECPYIDCALVYEGEHSFVEVLTGKALKDIEGLIYKNERGHIVANSFRKMIDNLDEISFPKYSKFKLKKYGDVISIISSRGCPFSCTFCGAHLSMGKKWRGRSAKNLFNEIKYWYEKGYEEFLFVDSNFFFSRERVVELNSLLKQNNIKAKFYSDGLRAKDVTEDTAKVMREMGFGRVAVGIESVDDEVLKNIKKEEITEEMQRAMDLLLEYKINVIAFFVLGLPGDNMWKTLRSFLFALRYKNISTMYLFNANPVYKTELYEWAEREGYLSFSREDVYQNIGGMGNKILMNTPGYSAWQKQMMLFMYKYVNKLIIKRNKRWLKKQKL